MKKVVVLIGVIINFAGKTNAQTWWQSMYGEECVILNVNEFTQSEGEEINEYEWGNSHFDNITECERFYQYNYGYYPFENDFTGYKGWIQVKYHCVPCTMVYGIPQKSASETKSTLAGSKLQNLKNAKEAKHCFGSNEDSYNDFLNSVPLIADDIFMEIVDCDNGQIQPKFYKKTTDGKEINVGENERTSIDSFYNEMKERSKARQVNELAKQMKRAQTSKEASELLNQLQGIFGDLKQPKVSNSDGIISSRDLDSEGSKELILDSDSDGIADTKVTVIPGRETVYESIVDDSKEGDKSTTYKKYESEDGANVVEQWFEDVLLGSVRVYDDHEEIERADGTATQRFDTDVNGIYDKEYQFSPEGELISEKSLDNSLEENSISSAPAYPGNETIREESEMNGKNSSGLNSMGNSSGTKKLNASDVSFDDSALKGQKPKTGDKPDGSFNAGAMAGVVKSLTSGAIDKDLDRINKTFKTAAIAEAGIAYYQDRENKEKKLDFTESVISLSSFIPTIAGKVSRFVTHIPRMYINSMGISIDASLSLLNGENVNSDEVAKKQISNVFEQQYGVSNIEDYLSPP